MHYLTGKRFTYLGEGNAAGTKTGVIVSEPFRDIDVLSSENIPLAHSTNVAVLWDDGSMEGAIDIEVLKIDVEDSGYVVCTTWPDPNSEVLIHETWWSKTSLRLAKIRMNQERFKDKNPRIAKLNFIEMEEIKKKRGGDA